jgi:hypothetical protein
MTSFAHSFSLLVVKGGSSSWSDLVSAHVGDDANLHQLQEHLVFIRQDDDVFMNISN